MTLLNVFIPLLVINHISSFTWRGRISRKYPAIGDSGQTIESPNSNDIASVALLTARDWIKQQSLATIVPKDDLNSILFEIRNDSTIWDESKGMFDKIWTDLDKRLRSEKRTVKELLGKSGADRVLAAVESTNIYEPESVRMFLKTPAFETMIGGILYEGIFEFIQKVDILGNIINNLPIIGPIRQTIIKEFKKSLDSTLGGQIKIFLASFNRVAVQRMADFILSPENTKSFLRANRNLVDSIISRPINSFLPDIKTSEELKLNVWNSLKDVSKEDLSTYINELYEFLDNKTIDKYINVESVSNRLPSLTVAATKVIDNYFRSQMGLDFVKAVNV